MHSLLKRQLRRYLGGSDSVPKEWQGFIDAVNNAYFEFDADRGMLERSLELTSQELIEANSGMRAVFERLIYSSMDGIFAFDRECRYTVWNPALERILGLSKFQTLGKNAFDVFPFLKESGEDKFYRDALAGKTVVAKDRQYIVPGTGEQIFVEGHFSPLLDDSAKIIGGLAIFRDITERKRAEEALRRAQAELAHVTRVMTMGELTASIAHEINQPLAAVVTNANACLRWLAGPIPNLGEAREAVARITRDGNRASDVIGRIRALVKKSGTEQVHLDVNEVIQEVVGLLQSEIQKNGVVLRMELTADLPSVFGDRVQLQQVILNLVMNGIEAMSGVTDRSRELLIRSVQHESDQVLVAVQDSGVGIGSQNLEKIFNPFYTTKPQGMGMGLAISRSIVENHGGQLSAVPNDRHGATFQFTLMK